MLHLLAKTKYNKLSNVSSFNVAVHYLPYYLNIIGKIHYKLKVVYRNINNKKKFQTIIQKNLYSTFLTYIFYPKKITYVGIFLVFPIPQSCHEQGILDIGQD